LVVILLLVAATAGCRHTEQLDLTDGQPDGGTDSDSDSDTDTDTDSDGDTDADTDTDTSYQGPTIPQTCEQAEQTATTVGCLFYAVDLDSHDSVEAQQFAVVVATVNEEDTAHVVVSQGNPMNEETGFDQLEEADIPPLSMHTFELPDYHMNSSGVMEKGSFKIESDLPIIAYQFNPVNGASSYLTDASVLIPVPSLSLTYDVVGWKQSCESTCDGDMRAYFTVVATEDGTELTVEPSVSPLEGGAVPSGTAPFDILMDEGDVLEVETDAPYDSLTGSRITANAGHPIAVFSGQECAFIPEEIYACDHLEEQLPGLEFWGTEFVAARMPVRSTASTTDEVLWQIYATEDGTEVTLQASGAAVSLPFESASMDQGELLEFYVHGDQDHPGDFLVQASEPIAVMQYMIGSANPNCGDIGDPSMAYNVPTEQFLPLHVVLVPSTWINDALVITRHAAQGVLLDDFLLYDDQFVPVADSGFEVARIPIDDGIHTLRAEDEEYGLAVMVVGYDSYDSYAYVGGMRLAVTNSKYQ
jgi:hypothetical protein